MTRCSSTQHCVTQSRDQTLIHGVWTPCAPPTKDRVLLIPLIKKAFALRTFYLHFLLGEPSIYLIQRVYKSQCDFRDNNPEVTTHPQVKEEDGHHKPILQRSDRWTSVPLLLPYIYHHGMKWLKYLRICLEKERLDLSHCYFPISESVRWIWNDLHSNILEGSKEGKRKACLRIPLTSIQ